MTAKEPAWKKFLKLKGEVPVPTANIADNGQATGTKRKREPLESQQQQHQRKSILKKNANHTRPAADSMEKKVRANKQKKKAKTKIKRSKKDEADSNAARGAAMEYLSLYHSARTQWKFSKQRQNYLLKHVYDDAVISDERWAALLDYLSDLKGGARERCCEEAKELVERYGKQSGGTSEEQDGQDGQEKVDAAGERDVDEEEKEELEAVTDEQYERAQKVVETLTASRDAEPNGSAESSDGD